MHATNRLCMYLYLQNGLLVLLIFRPGMVKLKALLNTLVRCSLVFPVMQAEPFNTQLFIL